MKRIDNKGMTQTETILEHLRANRAEGITPREAITFYGIYRLGARIWDLKHDGHEIRTELVKKKGTNERKATKYARYTLGGEE